MAGPASFLERKPPPGPDLGGVLFAVLERWRAYETAEIDLAVSPVDDMLAAAEGPHRDHYFAVGRAAAALVAEAMVLAGRTDFPRALDLPCGGGRATRHLVKLLPDSEITVSDAEADKQAAVAAQFGLRALDVDPDFAAEPAERFDLIFVGSLVTHLDEAHMRRAVDFLVRSLQPQGVLILTTHGRRAAGAWTVTAPPEDPKRRALEAAFSGGGFHFGQGAHDRRIAGLAYGGAFCTPEWLMALVQPRTDCRILGFKEYGWDRRQDVLTLQAL